MLSPTCRLGAALLALAAAPFVAAQEPDAVQDPATTPLEGHSHIGEAFNEGPRQAAYLMAGMNAAVHLPVSTDHEQAQAFVDQGLVQLHGFWYFEAERSFRQAAALDAELAMAYWGMAMANVENGERAHGFAREAWQRRESVSPREQLYIEAIARFHGADREQKKGEDYTPPQSRSDADKQRRKRYVNDMEELIWQFPEDVEAKALLANQLWLDMRAGISTPSRMANEALLAQVFAAVPNHPAHHYRVHLWDSKETAAKVTDSAAAIGPSGPGIAHLWHMAGHIWAKLDRHGDAAWQQEASARVDHAHMMRDRVMPDQIHNYAHNNEWLCRSLRHVGRVHESIDLACNMVELPRHPDWNNPARGYNSANYGVRRLLETLEVWECWDEVLRFADTMYLDQGDDVRWSSKRLRLLARARFARGERAALAVVHDQARAMLDELRAERAAAVDAAEEQALTAGRKADEIDKAMDSAGDAVTRKIRDVRKITREIEGLACWLDDDRDRALELLEDSGHDATHLSRLWLEHGDQDKARKHAERAARGAGQAQPLANLVHVLWACGDRETAGEKFAELRAFSSRFELDRAPLRRLQDIAAELNLPADWRQPAAVATDVGDRPDLDTLGPFRWAPMPAESWTLPDATGTAVSLADFEGRPVLLVFFLGFGCVHCVEQLQALKPIAERYATAGIQIVAIGTDEVEQLAESESNVAAAERYPFPILSDPAMEVFRRYRAWDDFEDFELHGTFLVDPDGLVRWQDIGYEPFMDLEFLLDESQRLLALPTSKS